MIVLLKHFDLFLCDTNLSGQDSPIMLALCLMHSGTYYAKNYAGIIDLSLLVEKLSMMSA